MRYVYILESLKNSDKHYVGIADDVADRLRRHNSGHSESGSRHTDLHRLWKLVVQIGFEDRTKAIAFERYLKSGSGRAFAKRHF